LSVLANILDAATARPSVRPQPISPPDIDLYRRPNAERSTGAETGERPFATDVPHLFFQLVSHRSERGAMLATSNRPVSEWGSMFGHPAVPPFPIACFITATSSPSAATAICAKKRRNEPRQKPFPAPQPVTT
jgi:hypothetical protein